MITFCLLLYMFNIFHNKMFLKITKRDDNFLKDIINADAFDI